MTVYRFPVSSVLRAAFPANGLRADVERAMDDVFATRTATPLPLADAREDAASYTIELDVPGVMPEHVEVLAEDGVLTVRGARAARELADDQRVVMSERAHGSFARRFRLPKSADQNAITASYAHGVLTVRIAKLVPAQPRRVTVSVDAGAPGNRTVESGAPVETA